MSKKKQRAQQAAKQPQPIKNASIHQSIQSSSTKTSASLLIFGAIAVIALIVGVLIWFSNRDAAQPAIEAQPTLGAPATIAVINKTPFPLGGSYRCREQPRFLTQFGYDERLSALSTSERFRKGLVLKQFPGQPNNPNLQAAPVKTFQHETWDDAGWLGPITLDKLGNVYIVPVPVISVYDNPTGEQNVVWRVDSMTGVLTKMLSLPPLVQPDATNPFGALGATYDCDTNSLYVTSVMGSTRQKENGRLYRIDLAKNEVASIFDNVDALGVSVFNTSKGKRLYFGSSRKPEIRSIALDDFGNFVGAPRMEFSLENLGPRGDDKARRINFLPNNDMEVFGIEFGFNLIAPTEKQETKYRFKYDAGEDKWKFIDPLSSR
jgi:hypothetical protein